MNFVQTLYMDDVRDPFRASFGWVGPEYHLMGWALSCLQLHRIYGDITLYANSSAARLLVDALRLPYSGVNLALDQFTLLHPDLWAMPKIYTYSLQEQPFLQKINELFMESRDYQKVYSDSRHYCFDECSFMYKALTNAVSVYDIDWKIQSMTYLVRKAHDEGRINALFEFFVVEGVPGDIQWRHGKLYYNNEWEALLYHLNEFKIKAKRPELTYYDIASCYSITENEITLSTDKPANH